MRPSAATFGVALLGIAGCAPVGMGPDPDFVWWTDNESGDLSDWKQRGSTWESGGGTLAAVSSAGPQRSLRDPRGRFRTPAGTISGAVLVAENMPARRLLQRVVLGAGSGADLDLLDLLQARIADGGRLIAATGVAVWDFDLEPAPEGVKLRLFHHPPRGRRTDHAQRPYRSGAGSRSRRTFARRPRVTASCTCGSTTRSFSRSTGPLRHPRTWGGRSAGPTEDLAAPQAALLLDDAAVTTRRLGTQFPRSILAETLFSRFCSSIAKGIRAGATYSQRRLMTAQRHRPPVSRAGSAEHVGLYGQHQLAPG